MPQVEFYLTWSFGFETMAIEQATLNNGHEAVLMEQLS